MPNFKYLKDPLFVICSSLCISHRMASLFGLRITVLRHHLDDILSIPILVPIMLAIQRMISIKKTDAPPLAHEVFIPVVVFSLLFEVVAPNWLHLTVTQSDPLDVLCYTLSGTVATLFWGCYYRRSS